MPNDDLDGDGYTVAQGDCNDCDPLTNPGAIDVLNYDANNSPLPDAQQIDEDCSGSPVLTSDPATCDTGIALNDTNALNGAKAIDICTKVGVNGVQYGLVSAAYVHANGAAFANPGLQVGIESSFGTNVPPKLGANMLALSSGHARTTGQNGFCTGAPQSCTAGAGTPPPGFPQDVPNCAGQTNINDDVALEVHLKAPTNATGFKYKFRFYSTEYAEYVCTSFNDQFIALMTPPPAGALNGNISFDANNNPVSVNIAFFDVCNPANIGDFAENCFGASCPTAPTPYCQNGTTELQGTGFENDGGTSWLQTTAPVTGGQEFTLRFAIWDTGDQAFDSTVVIDDFEWIATGSVDVGTVSCTSGGTGTCNTCFYENVQATGCCGNEFSACHNDGQCENIYTCLSFCNGNAACEAQCPNDFPAGVAKYKDVTNCLYGDPAVNGSVGACGVACQ